VRIALALLPPAVAGILLTRASSLFAAAASLATGLVLLTVFPAPPSALLRSETVAFGTGTEVVLIILGGILLYEVISLAGAHELLGEWIAGLTADPARFILLMVLGVIPFAESVTGFGVGVIIALPLLRRMGFPPVRAAILALLGLIAIPWGALGPGTLVASRLTGVPLQTLGVNSAVLSLPVFLVAGFGALATGVGVRTAAHKIGELFVVAASLWAGIWGANRVAGTPIAGVLGSLAGIGMVLFMIRIKEGRLPAPDRRLLRGGLPYALLASLLLLSRLAGTLWFNPGSSGRLAALHAVVLSPATWLFATCAATPFLLTGHAGGSPGALRLAVKRWWPVAGATLGFLLLGALMTSAGMAAVLAQAAARLGRGYLALAPWIGGLGGFITGSNAGGNAMFATAQAEAARHLGYPVERVVAVQNVSASLLSMASAPRIALALSLLGVTDRGASIFRTVLMIDLAVLALLSGIAVTALAR
jgi:lactate permease